MKTTLISLSVNEYMGPDRSGVSIQFMADCSPHALDIPAVLEKIAKEIRAEYITETAPPVTRNFTQRMQSE